MGNCYTPHCAAGGDLTGLRELEHYLPGRALHMASLVHWREHYTALCKGGEAKGLQFNALADHIARGLTGEEYRAMIQEWGPILDRARQDRRQQ